MADQPCHIRYTSDGQPVRVNGDIDQETLDALGRQVRAIVEASCRAESSVPMPAIAQKMHGRVGYTCGREKGHDGPHRWPADGARIIAEWSTPPERHVCPECEQGKHANCDGTAWDDAKDEPTSCTCTHETTTTTGAGLI